MRVSLLFVFSPLLTLPLFSYAQTTASSTASTTESGGFFEAIIENVTGIKDTVVEETSSQSVLSAAAEKRLTNLAANISNRLDGLIARLRQISGRMEVRINKQAESGYNVDQARASLATANELLSTAENELKDIDREVYRAFRSLTPKEDWREVRATYIRARDNIRGAHTELKNTVRHLKSATPTPTAATSTATST